MFETHAAQLELLISLGLLNNVNLQHPKSYMCPICLRQFSADDLNISSSNMLTLEDAPPKALGGRKVALTCKKCNNSSGYEIDSHLAERMVELDHRSFLPSTSFGATFQKDGHSVTGVLNVDDSGQISVSHNVKHNNPSALEHFISTIGSANKDKVININFRKSKVDPDRLAFALLKTAYILTFAKFGYTFILDKSYDVVREQLLNPSKTIYPREFWTSQPFSASHEGVHLLIQKDLEGIFPIFRLATKHSVKRFGVYLPIPGTDLNNRISKLGAITSGFSLKLKATDQRIDYLTDAKGIQELLTWIESVRANKKDKLS